MTAIDDSDLRAADALEAAERERDEAVKALEMIDQAWKSATNGRPDYHRITGWTGSNDNPAAIFAWVARAALTAAKGAGRQ